MGSGDTVDGDTTVMIEAAQSFNNIVQDVPKLMSRRVEGACGGGLDECAALVQADAAATRSLQTFVMRVRYGIAAYGKFARDSGVAYRDADAAAAANLVLGWRLQNTGSGLPGLETFQQPPAK
ncbi:hypothetical protein DMC63_18545 [Streptomyces sp. WAC 05977]|nr:hypothetical protein DMC63_18545 [Streptomyces sp. WAC 05977]